MWRNPLFTQVLKGEVFMNKLKRIIAALLVSVVFFAAVPVKQDTVYADVTYVDREVKNPYWINGLYEFLNRLYITGLGRPADSDGVFNWFNHIIYDGYSGSDLVRGILYSPEFLNKNVSNRDFVLIVYRTILDREADPEGLANWTAKLDAGVSRQTVLEGFLGSVEWSNLCRWYGIPSGNNVAPSIAVLPTFGSRTFVNYLSTQIVNNPETDDNVERYAAQVLNFEISGTELAHQYLFSPTVSAMSNYDYLTRVYRTILAREPDGDFNDNLNKLNNGTLTREQMFNQAVATDIWAQTCGGFGVLR